MRRSGERHYSEEELLMHFLGEETDEAGAGISGHLTTCGECHSIYREYADLVGRIRGWQVPEVPVDIRQALKAALLARYRQDRARGRGGLWAAVRQYLVPAWNYALENPLPTLGYIAVAVAFALERTISTFRLTNLLPGAGEVIELLRQVF